MAGFSCNLRAIYMSVEYEKPLDTAEAVFRSGKTVHMNGGGWYRDHLRTSDNRWYRQLATTATFYTSGEEADEVFEKIVTEGDAVVATSRLSFLDWSARSKNVANVHFAREAIMNYSPNGWAVQKGSPWLEALNRHILSLDQALIIVTLTTDHCN